MAQASPLMRTCPAVGLQYRPLGQLEASAGFAYLNGFHVNTSMRLDEAQITKVMGLVRKRFALTYPSRCRNSPVEKLGRTPILYEGRRSKAVRVSPVH